MERFIFPLAFLSAIVFSCSGPDPREPSNGGRPAPAQGENRPGADRPGGGHQGGGDPVDASFSPEELEYIGEPSRLTSGGSDAEAYFSADGKRIVFQSTRDGREYDQIFVMNSDGSGMKMVSPGKGKTTCSFFFPGGERILYGTTGLSDLPPRSPDRKKGEAWVLDPGFEIVSANVDGTDVRRLTDSPGYDAEAAVSRADGRIVFCSMRTGDPEIFIMNSDGSGVRQLTDEKGYDGGPFFTPDGKRIVWRTWRPKAGEEEEKYDALIGASAVGRWPFDIWMMNPDGTEKTRITRRGEDEGLTCWAPYVHPDNRRIVFVSITPGKDRGMPNFDLYLVNVDGKGLERITTSKAFDGFPMFSDDGKKIVFASSRGNRSIMDTSIYVADWKK